MDEAILKTRLTELICYINSVKTPAATSPAAGINNGCLPMRDRSQSPHELFDYLRIATKYLLLDLEATRRENAILRKIITDNRQ